ncbi:glycosyltransferase [Maribacter aestuarii]|uniref:glycosyltransferase n=1 Tax=Maribacter aestuarii TaxID=1130723 RepID=UPI00248D2346|nr:glycosyltransferase [Maribacter aestuarii]
MGQPQVSILIPFKNTAPYLPECINSIMEQTLSQWEIIAVDDGSTDDSLEIMQDYAIKDERIQVLNNRGTGIIEALRTAYELSHGEFVTRMDSDDLMASQRLEHMVAALKERGKGHLAIGQVKYFSARGISNGYDRYEKWLNKLTCKGNNFSEIYKECVIPSPCWMIQREDFERCGAFQSDRYPEDYDLAFRFYENNLTCIPCDGVLLYWRDYETRTSRTSEHYAQNYFLDIKLHYFLKLDWNPKRPLTLWGAGNKGKTIAKLLVKKDIHFHWICDNPNKIGKEIYGQKLYHFNALKKLENPQTIVTVANSKAQEQIRDYFMTLNKKNMEDYFFFC